MADKLLTEIVKQLKENKDLFSIAYKKDDNLIDIRVERLTIKEQEDLKGHTFAVGFGADIGESDDNCGT